MNPNYKARSAALEDLIRARCDMFCAPFRLYKRHAPECLVEEAGL